MIIISGMPLGRTPPAIAKTRKVVVRSESSRPVIAGGRPAPGRDVRPAVPPRRVPVSDALPPVVSGDFSISDLIRGAAERALPVSYVAGPSPQIESPLMSGKILAEEVQPGLLMSGLDLTYSMDARIAVQIGRSVGCAVLLDGWGESLEVPGHPPIGHQLGHASIVGYGEPTICARPWRRGQRTRAFGVTLTPCFFERFHGTLGDDDLASLQSFMEPGLRSTILPWSRQLVDIAEAALNEPYAGSLSALYRESQALRFVFEVGSMLRTGRRLVAQLGLRQYDRVCRARETLDHSLVDPPKVLDLAKALGVNATTLQGHFKAAFGTTIFGYVRNRRLEMGRILILDHGLGIAEAGYRVGFNSAAAFTAACRRHFGYPPSVGR